MSTPSKKPLTGNLGKGGRGWSGALRVAELPVYYSSAFLTEPTCNWNICRIGIPTINMLEFKITWNHQVSRTIFSQIYDKSTEIAAIFSAPSKFPRSQAHRVHQICPAGIYYGRYPGRWWKTFQTTTVLDVKNPVNNGINYLNYSTG